MDAQTVSPLLTAKIVGSYLRHNTVGASELPDLIATVHRSLSGLGQQPLAEQALTPAVSVRQSVRQDYVVCLDCGYRGRTLRRHISSRHGLSRAEYLNRWGLPPDHLLTAPAYSEHRSTLAKQLGLGRKPKAEVAARPGPAESTAKNGDEKVEPDQPDPNRTRSKADVVDEAAAQPTKTRRRRTRSRAAPAQSEPAPTPTLEAGQGADFDEED
jgi:MucR family transcriptional regulator, transcriptional regulator of exopolysaccharide biosynthesis